MVMVSQSGCLGSEGDGDEGGGDGDGDGDGGEGDGDGDIVFDNVDYGSDGIVIAIMFLLAIAILFVIVIDPELMLILITEMFYYSRSKEFVEI